MYLTQHRVLHEVLTTNQIKLFYIRSLSSLGAIYVAKYKMWFFFS